MKVQGIFCDPRGYNIRDEANRRMQESLVSSEHLKKSLNELQEKRKKISAIEKTIDVLAIEKAIDVLLENDYCPEHPVILLLKDRKEHVFQSDKVERWRKRRS